MMKFKVKSLFAAMMMTALVAAGCNENTDNPVGNNNGTTPNAPMNLMANSLNSTTVRLKWTSSTTLADSISNYTLSVTGLADQNVPKGLTTYDVTGLTAGTVYTFTLKAKGTNGNSSTATTIQWSPASRINGVKIYESASSSFGSGIDLSTGIVSLVAAGGANWDIAIDTKLNSLDIGSPSLFNYAISSPRATLISEHRIDNQTSLDNVFDTKALGDNATMKPDAARTINFDNVTSGFVFFAKTVDGNYAKILVKADAAGKILQGTSPNRYVEMDISYQTVANVPYAQ